MMSDSDPVPLRRIHPNLVTGIHTVRMCAAESVAATKSRERDAVGEGNPK